MKNFGLRVFLLAFFVAGISLLSGAQTVGLALDVPFQFKGKRHSNRIVVSAAYLC